jgi:hypothetical protein
MRKGELMVIIYKALEQAMPSGTAENPLETWANFMDRFEAHIQEKQGLRNSHNPKRLRFLF